MTKLLIVDDEQVEREGLEAILQKSFPELIVKQAKNGKVAVQMAEEFKPDLVLMDIKMPGMNGIEAVERISGDHPHIKFIMVTAFDTFDYARQAIKLGVKDYLLKPSKASEIVATVGRVLDQISEEQKRQITSEFQQASFEKTLTLVETDVVSQLLFDHVHEVHLDMLIEMLDIRSTNENFVLSVRLPASPEQYYSEVKKRARETKSTWVGPLYGRQLPIIVFREPNKTFRSQAISIANRILSIAEHHPDSGWFIGIGNVYVSLKEIRQSYQESLIATMDSRLPVKYRFYSDVPAVKNACGEQVIKYGEKQLFDQIRLGQWEEVHLYAMDLIQSYEVESFDLLFTQQRVLEFLWITSRVLSEVGVETVTPIYSFQAQDYQQLRRETAHLVDRLKDSYARHHDRLAADTINQLKQYIFENSHEDISLETLGKKVGLSPIYISKMFKEKLGVNYIDFLTECRIEKAKKLLGDPSKSIKEITFEVGYREPNYFSKVFKKISSLSPKDYRNTLLGKKG